MKAARFFAPSRDGPTPIDVTILPKPTCPKSGALVRVRYSGICHSDLHLWEGSYDLGGGKRSHFKDRPHFNYPLTPGHEIAGRIEEIGVAAAAPSFDLTIGDRVIVYPWIGCTVCARCRHKLTNLCEGDANAAGKDVGFYESGGYAEYVVVPDVAYVVKIPDDIDGPTAATLPCAGLTAYAAVTKATASALRRAADVDETPRLLIVGAGGVGRWAATLARFCVPSRTRIVVADVDQAKLDDVGACRIVNELIRWRNDDVDDDLRRTVDVAGGRLDAVVDFVNSSATAKLALECTRCGGTVVAVGLFGGSAEIALPSIALSSRSIVGSYTGNVGQLRDLVRLVSDQRTISTPPVVKCRLDEIQSILEKLRVGKVVGRAVIDMEAVVDS